MKFKVGDIVEAFGVNGEVRIINDGISYPVKVLFVTGDTDYFRQDGRQYAWHEVPSLKLIKRAKKYKEVTIETYGIVAQGYVIHSDDKLFIESSFSSGLGLNPDNKKIKITYYIEDKE